MGRDAVLLEELAQRLVLAAGVVEVALCLPALKRENQTPDDGGDELGE
jgi:hypothetical protein